MTVALEHHGSPADRIWGGKRGSAEKAQAAMEQHYGPRKGMAIYAAKTVQRERGQSGVRGALATVRRHTL